MSNGVNFGLPFPRSLPSVSGGGLGGAGIGIVGKSGKESWDKTQYKTLQLHFHTLKMIMWFREGRLVEWSQ